MVLTLISLALATKERRPSSSSVHSSRPKVRRPTTTPHGHPTILNNTKAGNNDIIQDVQFSTKHSSDEEDNDDDKDPTLVHRKSAEIVESPQHQGELLHPAPSSMIPPRKS